MNQSQLDTVLRFPDITDVSLSSQVWDQIFKRLTELLDQDSSLVAGEHYTSSNH